MKSSRRYEMSDEERKKRDDEYIELAKALSNAVIDEAKQGNDVLEGIAVKLRAALSGAKFIQKKGVNNGAN